MYTISSSSPDTKSLSCSSLGKTGAVKLLILAIVFPIMILTIVNPMWICIFMKHPHLHPVSVGHPASHDAHGIKITQESIDVIVASKDGRRVEELETTITVIENIQPSTNNNDENKPSRNESTLDRIRERLFRNKNSCTYISLSVLLLCAVTIYGVTCFSSGNIKMYESVNVDDYDDNDENRSHYVKIADENDEKLNENNLTENETTSTQDATTIDCNDNSIVVQSNDNISTSNLLPPPYSSNTNNELISTPPSKNIQ